MTMRCLLGRPLTSGVAVQHPVLSCGHVVLSTPPLHVRAPKGMSTLRARVQDGEDRPAADQAGSPDQNKLQRRHSGELLPAGEDRDVGESPDFLLCAAAIR